MANDQTVHLPPNFPNNQAFMNWYSAVMKGIGAPETPQNYQFMVGWTLAENTNAKNNPLASTQPWTNASPFNTLSNGGHVWNYATYQDGVNATIVTLKNGYYPTIITNLQKGNVDAASQAQADAQELDTWGSGGAAVLARVNQVKSAGIGNSKHSSFWSQIGTDLGKAAIDAGTGNFVGVITQEGSAVKTGINATGLVPNFKSIGDEVLHYALYGLAAFGSILLLLTGLVLVGADLGISLLARSRVAATGQKTIGSIGGYRQQKAQAQERAQNRAKVSARADELHERRIARAKQQESLNRARIRQERAKARREELTVPRASKPRGRPPSERTKANS